MKTFFLALTIVCIGSLARAQNAGGLYNNQLKGFGKSAIGIDTSLSSRNNLKTLTPADYLNLQKLNATPLLALANTGSTTVYSRMPVAHLQSTDKMPVAHLQATDHMPTLKFEAGNPLKPIVPVQ
jgi:hypothetical protein